MGEKPTTIKDFTIDGCRALILKHPSLKHLCGYVGLPIGHALHGKNGDDDDVWSNVHGGWTYSGECAPREKPDGRWYLGFDCCHAGDFVPGLLPFGDADAREEVYRDKDFVEGELRKAVMYLNSPTSPGSS